MIPVGAAFVFTRDGDLTVFASADAAAGWLEATDVADGEYDAFYTMDGWILTARAEDKQLILSVTGSRDEAGLRQRLRDYQRRVGLASSPEEPRAVANELLRLEWEQRWPRCPAWLSRRLHGDGPPQV